MSYENTAGLGVLNQYGPRFTQDGPLSGGILRTAGAVDEVVIYIKGSDLADGNFDTRATIPAGAKVLDVVAEVTEAFALGGTTPTINVGTNGTEGTNYGIELSKAQAEATGTYFTLGASAGGTWAAPLAAATAVGVDLDGTTPTATSVGAAKVVIRYIKI